MISIPTAFSRFNVLTPAPTLPHPGGKKTEKSLKFTYLFFVKVAHYTKPMDRSLSNPV